MFASLAVLLYAAHLLADYALQTDHQAAHKAAPGMTGWCAAVSHAATHVAVSAALLALGSVVLEDDPGVLPAAVGLMWIGGTHAVLDRRWPITWWMTHARQHGFAEKGGGAHVDQAGHVAALVLGALAMTALS